jgi:hypothetical protein
MGRGDLPIEENEGEKKRPLTITTPYHRRKVFEWQVSATPDSEPTTCPLITWLVDLSLL